MEFKLNFSTNNAAFDENVNGEISRILREIADRIENGESFDKCRNIFEANGNIVGVFSLK
jgi:hypothetical protein